jgi:hypothetical protein
VVYVLWDSLDHPMVAGPCSFCFLLRAALHLFTPTTTPGPRCMVAVGLVRHRDSRSRLLFAPCLHPTSSMFPSDLPLKTHMSRPAPPPIKSEPTCHRNTRLVNPTSSLFMKPQPMKPPLPKDVDVVVPLSRVFDFQVRDQGCWRHGAQG